MDKMKVCHSQIEMKMNNIMPETKFIVSNQQFMGFIFDISHSVHHNNNVSAGKRRLVYLNF